MKSTIEAFLAFEQGQFRPQISDFALSRIEEGIILGAQEYLRRVLTYTDVATVTLPWGTYTARNHDKGNINIDFEIDQDFKETLDDPDGRKAVFMEREEYEAKSRYIENEELKVDFLKLYTDYVTYGKFFDLDDSEEKKKESDADKGINLTEYQASYFPNRYAMMMAKMIRDHKADGEIYRIELCDTVPHGVFEVEYSGDECAVKFTADKSFKQYLKNDNTSDD